VPVKNRIFPEFKAVPPNIDVPVGEIFYNFFWVRYLELK
jgi:hypothetical protein